MTWAGHSWGASRLLVLVAVLTTSVQFGVSSSPDAAALTPAQRAWPPGQWSMLQNSPEHRGVTPLVGPQTSNLVWQYSIQTNYGGAAIARDGTIYQPDDLGTFYAFSPDGTIKWTYSTAPYGVEGTPGILPDGRVVIINSNGVVIALNPDGTRSWMYRDGDPCACPEITPVIGRDATIYFFRDFPQTVYALHPDGTVRWTYDVGDSIGGPPAVRADGVVYVPNRGLLALDPDGHFLWHSASFSPYGTAPAIGPDGTIYVNSIVPTALHAINPNGTRKWRYKLVGGAQYNELSSPAISPDGTIYFGNTLDNGNGEGVVVALNPDGSPQWEAHYGYWPTDIAVGGDGTLYFGSGSASPNHPAVYALNPDGTLKWQHEDSFDSYIRTPPAIGKDGRLYMGADSSFFAFGP